MNKGRLEAIKCNKSSSWLGSKKLRDSIKIEKWVILLFPSKVQKRANKSVSEIKNLLSRYFRGLIIQISILISTLQP